MARSPKTQAPETPADSLPEEVRALRREVARLNGHRFIRLHDSLVRLVWFNFLRGLAFGLGSVIGATALVSIAVYALSQIDFIPIIGDWAKQIADQITNGTAK